MPIICYNTELVRGVGGDHERLPEDWPGIVELDRRIQALGPDIIGGFFEHDVSGNWSFMYLLESLGGRMMAPDETEVAFDGPEGMQALELVAEIGRLGQAEADMSAIRRAKCSSPASSASSRSLASTCAISSARPRVASRSSRDRCRFPPPPASRRASARS